MFDLSAFRLQDMALCSTTIRQLGEDARSIEDVANRITRFLYTTLTTGPDEDPACVLVRLFKTQPYNRLTPELQALVDARLGDKPTNLDMKCLTLLASTGAISGWNNPALSSRFRVIPLAGPEALAQLPMFAQLFAQFHVDVSGIHDTSTSLLLDQHATTFNAFHVPHAVNSPYVPGQDDFVVPFGVQSVFGGGGLLPTGDMFALVLFAKVPVSKDTADLFRTIALSVKLAIAPFEHSQLILPGTDTAQDSGHAKEANTLTALEDRVATLEAILAAQEQTVEVQSRRLEDNLAEAIEHGRKLQEQSLRFETLSATSPVGIFQTDADGGGLYVNDTWRAISGLSLTESVGDGWTRAIYEEDRPTVFAAWKHHAKRGDEFSLEFRMQRPDGTIRWVHARSRPMKDAAGLVIGHVGTTEDVTDRTLTTLALQESQQRFDLAVQGSQTGIWDWDVRTNQVYFSPIWKRQLGYEAHELQGRFEEWRDRLHPDDRDHALAAVESYLAGQTSGFELECRLRHKDGSYRWILARGVSIQDEEGKPYRMAGSHVDITEYKDALARLRDTEERWMFAFEGNGDGVWDWDATTNKVFFSNRWKEMLGYTEDEIGDTLDEWSSRVYPDDLPKAMADIQRHLLGESPVYINEHRMRCKDGSYKWIIDRGKVIARTPDGSPLRVVGTHTDITERKRSEEIVAHDRHQTASFIEHAPAAIAMLDRNLRYVAVSQRWLQDYRLGEQNILGKHHYDVFPEIRAMEEWQTIHRRCMAGAVERRDEQRFVRADGSDSWLRWEVRPWLDAAGEIGGIIMFTEDITKRKYAEEALRQSTTVQNALLTHAGYAVIVTDPSGLITVFNPAAEQLLGYTAEELFGKLTPTIFHDAEEVAVRATEFGKELSLTIEPGFDVFVEKARRNLPNQHEWTYIRKDGRRIPVMLSVTTLRDTSNAITGYIAMALDLTDRKASDAQFQLVMEAMPTGIVLVDEAGRITMVNQHVGHMFGYEPGALLGQPVEILLPERFRATHPAHVRTFFRSPTARAMGAGKDLSGLRKDGTEFFLEIGLAPIHAPEGIRIVASIADITKRKQMESTRFRLQQAINHAQDGMALFDDVGQFTYMNPAHAAIYGYTVDELLGKSWTQLYPEEWAAMIEQMYLPMLRSEGQWQGEVVGKKSSGDAFHVDLSLTLLEEPGTGRQTILCTCRDITHRKQMEHDLVTAKEAAEAGVRAKSEFLATMSHEIRTPMNGVLGMTDLLIDTSLTPEQHEFVHTLKHSGESLMRIINDILDFSKIEAGKLTIETLPFDLRLTIEDTLDLLAPTAQAKHLELVGLIDAQAPNAVIGDPGRIRQILTNLIGNAIKFTESGEVLVQVLKAEETAASVLLRFEIVDTGVGLNEEAKAKLFQSFTQADSSTARKYGGTGLGLAICKRLTELMGGQIGIQSFPGTGTCVWFTIRLLTQTYTAVVPTPPLIDNLSGLRICLVDDNATNRSLLQYHACDWKMHYDSAEDGPSALSLIRRAAAEGKPFDLAILDMHMPGMGGLELGRAIRADANLNGTRLVLLTSLGRRGDAKLAHASGFSAYLTKPVRKKHLYDCLRLVMGQAPSSHADSPAAIPAQPLITRHQVAEMHAHLRLLVVDDNPINQKVAVKMLEKLGYRVDVASNGNEALAALTRHHYNLVFMDCQMPELDGFDTTRMIRAHEQPGCHLPIIAMTANAMEGDREHCLDSGMDDFVSKPVKSQDLNKMLTQWLNPSDDRAAA